MSGLHCCYCICDAVEHLLWGLNYLPAGVFSEVYLRMRIWVRMSELSSLLFMFFSYKATVFVTLPTILPNLFRIRAAIDL